MSGDKLVGKNRERGRVGRRERIRESEYLLNKETIMRIDTLGHNGFPTQSVTDSSLGVNTQQQDTTTEKKNGSCTYIAILRMYIILDKSMLSIACEMLLQ